MSVPGLRRTFQSKVAFLEHAFIRSSNSGIFNGRLLTEFYSRTVTGVMSFTAAEHPLQTIISMTAMRQLQDPLRRLPMMLFLKQKRALDQLLLRHKHLG